MNGTDLSGANLYQASLKAADLHAADLMGANVAMTDLSYSDLRRVVNLNLESLRYARDWNEAFYDDQILKALGLPPDHNAKLEDQFRQKHSPRPTLAAPKQD